MNLHFTLRLLGAHKAFLKCVSLLAPRTNRAEWLREWRGELSHIYRLTVSEAGNDWPGEWKVARFCAGSMNDAFCLRRDGAISARGSAAHCLLMLSAIAVACGALAFFLPAARLTLQPLPYRDARNLMLIGYDSAAGFSLPAVRADQYRDWRTLDQHFFSSLAYYHLTSKIVHAAHDRSPQITIARSTPNLFEVLGLSVAPGLKTDDKLARLPRLILSDSMWEKYFRRDGLTPGHLVKVGVRDAVFAGTMPSSWWRLPGSRPDAWLLEPDAPATDISDSTQGFVVARREPSRQNISLGDEWSLLIPRAGGHADSFLCTSLSLHSRQPLNLFLFTLALALLALPATTPLSLGEYPLHRHRLSWATRLRRWIFLACKLLFVVPIVGVTAIAVAYAWPSIGSVTSQYVQLLCSFSGCLFALRWILRDQRMRCPVCLDTLTSPAHVGQTSRNFLAWYGTELICNEGHGLLHVPELPTSWFATQRWLYLDSSWEVLFTEQNLASSGIP
jgi:hypothetical protein